MKSWQHLSFVLVIYLFQTAYTARISQTGNAVVNGPVTIECVFDSVAGSIQITDPAGNLAANCLVPTGTTSTCLPVTDPNYSSSQDVTTKTTSVTIAVTARATHEGTWTCTKTGDPPITTFLIILAIPTLNVAQTVSALTLSSSNTQTLTIAATCAYPAVSLVLYFVPTGGGTAVRSPSSTSSCTNSSSACADTDAQDYTCDIVPKLEASLSAGTYNMLVVVNLAGQYESIGLNATITDTVITVIEPTTTTPTREPTTTTPTPASRVCDDCEKTVIPLGSFGMVFALLVAAFCWLLYCLLSGKWSSPLYERAKDGDIEFTTKKLFWSTVIATVLCLLGFFLCLPGVIICGMCEEGVTTSGKVTTALILVIIGFILALIIMIVEIILLVLVCCRKIKIKDKSPDCGAPTPEETLPMKSED